MASWREEWKARDKLTFFYPAGETEADEVVGAASLPLPLEEQVQVIRVEGMQKAPGGKIMVVKPVRTCVPFSTLFPTADFPGSVWP